ncbi:MAG: hypothetical protein DMF72_18385 [Acidobacteria bacterium]|nr:MAG: hypothetical protein DMF72_18385 [Acidobacteriota bacterium]
MTGGVAINEVGGRMLHSPDDTQPGTYENQRECRRSGCGDPESWHSLAEYPKTREPRIGLLPQNLVSQPNRSDSDQDSERFFTEVISRIDR